ncbi:MAG: TonB-dependent receptor [Saprospiraceae bacterium]|nr:TonB-dependent receptor [Saprospiraceae bacterium]
MKKHLLQREKLLQLMRISLAQLLFAGLFAGMSYAHPAFSQKVLSEKLSFNVEDKKLCELLFLIEKQVDVHFSYLPKQIEADRKVSLQANNESLEKILNRVFKKTDIRFEVFGSKQILLSKVPIERFENLNFETLPAVAPRPVTRPDFTVKGTITNTNGDPLVGATVLLEGTTKGTVTDINGQFSLDLSDAESTGNLLFSFVGYTTVSVAINNQSTINVTLQEGEILDEVVVVGYGAQKKSSLTGAVSSVNQKDLKALPVISLTQAIQGRVPGVSITNNSSPGSDPIIRIRGIGSISLNPNPLFVIDGVPAGGLNNIDPKDIESLEVLKDASAASIYGSRAANGVVLITTKKGVAGKMRVNLDSYYGVQNAWKTLDLLNRDQYIQYGTALLTASGQPVPGRFNNLNTPVYEGASTTFAQTDTDWQDVMFRSAPITDHQLSLSGGNDVSRVYTSLGYLSQDGIMPFTDYERQSLRINSDHKVAKFLSFGQTLLVATDKRRLERDGGGRSLIMNTMRMIPYWPVRDPTKIGGFSTTAQGLDATDPENPLRIAEQEQQYQIDNGVKLLGTFYAEVTFAKWLKYRFVMGGDFANNQFTSFLPIYNDGNRSRTIASLSENRSTFFSKVFTNQLTFEQSFGKHNVNVIAVAEKQDARVENISASGQRPDNNIQVIQGVSNPNGSSFLAENSLISYVGRLTYDYDGKYLLGASIRRDGSSKFAPGRKWGVFPSVSVGWRISEEPFFQSISGISSLKLRGSIGQTGYNSIGDYEWQPLISANATIYPFNNQTNVLGSYFNSLGNIDLSWEETTMTNVGFDLSLFNNSFDLSAEYYQRKTDGLLLRVPLPSSAGYSSSPLANVGSMENKGFEFIAGYNYRSTNLNWTLTGTFDLVRNKVLSLATPNATIPSGSNADFGGFDITLTEAGHPIQSFYGWQVEGIFQNAAEVAAANALGNDSAPYQNASTAPGDIKFKDLNGDGKIDGSDRTYLGSYLPKFSYGLNWNGSFKNFDFALYFQGVQGNKIYNGTKVIGQGMLRLFNSTTDVLDAWTPQNTDTDVPRAVSGDPNQNTRTSDRFLENGSYLRLKNVSIGYTFSSDNLKKISGNAVSRVRVYVSSQNLLTFTKYSGYDPEVGFRGNSQLNNGIDYGLYPQARTILLGVNLGFN